jgi:hypothetical protein
MAQALTQATVPASVNPVATQQLGLYGEVEGATALAPAPAARPVRRAPASSPRPRALRPERLCKSCRASEARYGFKQIEGSSPDERPRALCFQCFREELDRRQSVAARISKGQYEQGQLPLDETLRTLSRRRHRAQIAARHALGLS